MHICVTKLMPYQGLCNELIDLEEEDKGKYFLSTHYEPGIGEYAYIISHLYLYTGSGYQCPHLTKEEIEIRKV